MGYLNLVQDVEHNDETLGSTQGRELLEQVNDYWLLNKDFI